MDRTSVVFTRPQMEWLNARAKELGIQRSELLRRIVDNARGEKQ